MSKPHECPVCHGTGKQRSGDACQPCDGKGIVWEPDGTVESADTQITDHSDLTYRQ